MTTSHGGPEGQAGIGRLKELWLFLPQLLKLLYELLREPRVPPRNKAIVAVVAGYLLLPFDIIPDFIPFIGQADDLVLVAFALDQILNRVPEEIVLEHWEGDDDVLQVVREVLEVATAPLRGRWQRFMPF
ncbi:MAG: YkvA family protein [Actinomycetota bacterium]|nr:YkvA family protein [Actinomycetota bacterium]